MPPVVLTLRSQHRRHKQQVTRFSQMSQKLLKKASAAGRSNKRKSDLADNEPTSQVTNSTDSTSLQATPAPKKTKKTNDIAPRSLPPRANRVVNPGAPDKPKAKRTSAQVASFKAQREQLQRDLAALDEEEKMRYAQMEDDDEAAEEKEECSAVNRVSDVIEISDRASSPPQEVDEDQTRVDIDDEADEEAVAKKVTQVSSFLHGKEDILTFPGQRKKRPGKGETRDDMEKKQEGLKTKRKADEEAEDKT